MIIKSAHLRELFADDPLRSTTMKINAGDLTLDFSHQRITTDTLTQLDKINQTMGLKERLHALFRGDIVNPSEARPALHTALRDRDTTPIVVDGQDIKPLIKKNLDEMFALCKTIWQSGITDVLVLGIGGSYWGSLNVCEALRHLPKRLNIHFLGDNEQEAFDYVTDKLIPQKTVVLIISKSFTTNETIRNAHRARKWLGALFSIHSIAITANRMAAAQLGVDTKHVLNLWSWVGGRYSVWSAVGMPIALCYGIAVFNNLLNGAYQMDQHVKNAPMRNNLPLMAALISFLNIRYYGATNEAIIPYCARLRHFIPYLQQLGMESLGKTADMHGNLIHEPTGPIIWGQTGVHAQHTFNQLLHQGSHAVPIDFILPLDNPELVTACRAQSRALAFGSLHPDCLHSRASGNQVHNILSFKQLTPEILGMLMAFYEHKTYLLACLFNINAFDQFGVELTKQLSRQEIVC